MYSGATKPTVPTSMGIFFSLPSTTAILNSESLALKLESKSICEDLTALWKIAGMHCTCRYSNPLINQVKINYFNIVDYLYMIYQFSYADLAISRAIFNRLCQVNSDPRDGPETHVFSNH